MMYLGIVLFMFLMLEFHWASWTWKFYNIHQTCCIWCHYLFIHYFLSPLSIFRDSNYHLPVTNYHDLRIFHTQLIDAVFFWSIFFLCFILYSLYSHTVHFYFIWNILVFICRSSLWVFFISTMSQLNTFDISCSFLNIWNLNIIAALMLFSINSIIYINSVSVLIEWLFIMGSYFPNHLHAWEFLFECWTMLILTCWVWGHFVFLSLSFSYALDHC